LDAGHRDLAAARLPADRETACGVLSRLRHAGLERAGDREGIARLDMSAMMSRAG
jgi:hypothetical protein